MVPAGPRSFTTPAVGIFDADILEKRIMMMKIKKQHPGRALKYGLAIPAALFLISAAVAGTAMAIEVEQQPSSAANPTNSYGPIYKIGKDVSPPAPLKTVDAEFPESARNLKAPFGQIVIVKLVVDASGMPRGVHVTRPYNPDFDAQAIKAVQKYRFIPAKRAGKPVAVALSIEVNFKKY